MTTLLLGVGVFLACVLALSGGLIFGRGPLVRGCTAPIPGLPSSCDACERRCEARDRAAGRSS